MPTIYLSDLTVQRLKPRDGEKQTRYFDQGLPNFGVLVGKRARTFFCVKAQDRRLVTLGRYPETTLKEARGRAKAEMLVTDRHGSPDAEEAIKTFLAEAKGRIGSQTHDQYTYYLDHFAFKGPVSEITRTHIKRKLAELAGKPTAQNMAYATLRGFLNWCLRQEYLEKHPLLGMAPPNRLSSRERVLSDDELKAVWNAADPNTGSPGYRKFSRIVRILILTGQRRQEICELTPAQVSDLLTFPKTKNGHAHMIPVTPLVQEHLAVPFAFNDWNRCKELLDEKSGVTGWVIHDIRRTWATNAARLGVSPHVIEATLNHRSGVVSGISKIYNRWAYQPEVREALLTVEAHIVRITTARASTEPVDRLLKEENVDGRKTGASQGGDEDGRVLEAAHRSH